MPWLYFSLRQLWVPFKALTSSQSEASYVINTAGHLLARKALLPIGHLVDLSVSTRIEAKWTGNYTG